METEQAYEVLGLPRGASFREVMEAHRDLVEVWDPKRFHENLRLQRRAVQELASINEAFDTLRVHAMQSRDPQSEPLDPEMEPAARLVELAVGSGADAPAATAAVNQPSLYEDAFPRPRGSRRFLALLPLITGVVLALVVIIWILSSDSGSDIDDQPSPPPSATAPAQQSDSSVQLQQGLRQGQETGDAGTAPAPNAELPGLSSTAGPSGSAVVAPKVQQAFELLREKSRTAWSLVEKGRYDNLRFESWSPLRAELREFQLQVIAIREPDGRRVRLVWSVNLETGTVSPLNDEAREIENRESGPKPRLIRQM